MNQFEFSLNFSRLDQDKQKVQTEEYMKHCARMAAIGAEPLTWLQFIRFVDKIEVM